MCGKTPGDGSQGKKRNKEQYCHKSFSKECRYRCLSSRGKGFQASCNQVCSAHNTIPQNRALNHLRGKSSPFPCLNAWDDLESAGMSPGHGFSRESPACWRISDASRSLHCLKNRNAYLAGSVGGVGNPRAIGCPNREVLNNIGRI